MQYNQHNQFKFTFIQNPNTKLQIPTCSAQYTSLEPLITSANPLFPTGSDL